MVFIVSILAQFIACVYACDSYCKTNNTFHFFLHKILWKAFEAIWSFCFVIMNQAT